MTVVHVQCCSSLKKLKRQRPAERKRFFILDIGTVLNTSNYSTDNIKDHTSTLRNDDKKSSFQKYLYKKMSSFQNYKKMSSFQNLEQKF